MVSGAAKVTRGHTVLAYSTLLIAAWAFATPFVGFTLEMAVATGVVVQTVWESHPIELSPVFRCSLPLGWERGNTRPRLSGRYSSGGLKLDLVHAEAAQRCESSRWRSCSSSR